MFLLDLGYTAHPNSHPNFSEGAYFILKVKLNRKQLFSEIRNSYGFKHGVTKT